MSTFIGQPDHPLQKERKRNTISFDPVSRREVQVARAATKRQPKVVKQLQMQVDTIVGRVHLGSEPLLTEERVTADGEIIDVPIAVPVLVPDLDEREPFGQWLLAQRDRGDWIDDLVKAARRDPAFPKRGTPDKVRDHLQARGADADAFEQLEDAERHWLGL